LRIKIFYDGIKYRIRGSRNLQIMLEKVIREENRVPGDLNYIITTDEKVVRINREFLGREYFTDVVSFNYSIDNQTSGEIYVSLDTVRRNSTKFHVTLEAELLRVMIHGLLHLVGYDDENKNDRKKMREREDHYMKKIKEEWSSGMR